jgi:hypothetical protein
MSTHPVTATALHSSYVTFSRGGRPSHLSVPIVTTTCSLLCLQLPRPTRTARLHEQGYRCGAAGLAGLSGGPVRQPAQDPGAAGTCRRRGGGRQATSGGLATRSTPPTQRIKKLCNLPSESRAAGARCNRVAPPSFALVMETAGNGQPVRCTSCHAYLQKKGSRSGRRGTGQLLPGGRGPLPSAPPHPMPVRRMQSLLFRVNECQVHTRNGV